MKLQPIKEIEQFYKKEDPWGYKTRPDDLIRRRRIISIIPDEEFQETLDIGCGEGFITEKLPGNHVTGIDVSKQAIERATRDSKNKHILYTVKNINTDSFNEFDLIVACGSLYPHYVLPETINKILRMTKKYLVTCHIKKIGNLDIPLEPFFSLNFGYNNMIEELQIYDLSNS